MSGGRRSSRALDLDEQSGAIRRLEREAVSNRLARMTPALQPHDSVDWKDPHCCFHAAIDGLTELSLFNNISMLELRTKVSQWLIEAPEPGTEGIIERWAIERQAGSSHIGTFRAQRQAQIRKQWREHCQGYGASQGTVHQGDVIALFAIAHIYNCKVTVHKKANSFDIAHPSTASKTLNLALFDVQSDILSENWSHFCSTRPIEPTERAGLDVPRVVGLEGAGHGLAHPPPAAGEDAPARALGRATDAVLRNGGSGSNNGRSGSSSGSSNGRAGSCNGRRPTQGPRTGPRIAARGADNDPPCNGGAAGEIYGPPIGPDADLHMRRYTQLTQRQLIRGDWSAQDKSDLLHRTTIITTR